MRALLVLGCVACQAAIEFPQSGGAYPSAVDYSWSHEERLALTDSYDDTLSFVSRDLPAPRLLAKLPVGDNAVDLEGPHDLKFSPSGDVLYLILSNYVPTAGSGPHASHGSSTVPGSILALDAHTLQRRAEVQLEPNAGELLLDESGATAFISHFDQVKLQRQVQNGLPASEGWSDVAVVDTATMTRTALVPVCASSHDLELSGDQKTLYVTCSDSDQLALVDVATHAVERLYVGAEPGPLLAANYFPYAALRAPADESVWISCNRSAELRVYDPRTHAMDPSRTVLLGGIPMFGAFLADGKTLIMPHQGDDRVSFIDTSAARELAEIALPPSACLNARNLELSADDRTAYVVCEGDHQARPGSIVAIDVASHAILGWVEVGLFPTAVALSP